MGVESEKLTGTHRSEDEDDYEYEFSVRMRIRFGGRRRGRHFSKCARSVRKTRTYS